MTTTSRHELAKSLRMLVLVMLLHGRMMLRVGRFVADCGRGCDVATAAAAAEFEALLLLLLLHSGHELVWRLQHHFAKMLLHIANTDTATRRGQRRR
jgi:hypothetical protein